MSETERITITIGYKTSGQPFLRSYLVGSNEVADITTAFAAMTGTPTATFIGSPQTQSAHGAAWLPERPITIRFSDVLFIE